MSDQSQEPVREDETDNAGATAQEYGNLTVEDDAEGTVNPADLTGSGGPDDDGGPENP